jgi:hypothetical protein
MITLEIQNLALQWFADNDIFAYEMGANIYVSTGEYDVQISEADIKVRASLQKSKTK